MNMQLLMILQSCDTLHELSLELNKPFGWTHIKSKKECLSYVDQIKQKIKDLWNDRWNISYLFETEYTIICYHDKLYDHLANFYISDDYNKDDYDPKNFIPIYFVDTSNGNIIMLEIVADTITFTIMDKLGNTFSVSSSDSVQPSQEKIVSVCKARLTETLNSYLDYMVKIDKFTFERLISDIKSIFTKNK